MKGLTETLEELFALEDGWLDGDNGKAITDAAKECATAISKGLTEDQGGIHAYPLEAGGVRFFWAESVSQLTVDVEPNGDVCLHALGMEPGTFQYVVLTEGESLGEYLTRWLA